jgi:tetratricopeptide (TPR) repeat protein
MTQSGNKKESTAPAVGPVGAIALLITLLFLTWNVGSSGFASLLTAYAAKSNSLAAADAAVNLNPRNPESHYVRALILEGTNDLAGSVDESYKAVLARPDDYVLWLILARSRETNGEIAGAIDAARQAVPLAPAYAQPHYQLGNILLRAGQADEAAKELRLAGASNPSLMPGILDLLWRTSGGNTRYLYQALSPSTPDAYQTLASFFRQRKQFDAAIAMYLAAGSFADQERREYVGELIREKHFNEANKLWSIGRETGALPGVMTDPGFEQESNLKDPGFGWRQGEKEKGFHLSLDAVNPHEGRSSLKVDFDGDTDPIWILISQLVMTEPSSRYQLRFTARSEDLISGGRPQIAVLDAETNKVLAESEFFPRSTYGWHDYEIQFEAGTAKAVIIALQRQRCSEPPCPIFGRLWLDNFSLSKSSGKP